MCPRSGPNFIKHLKDTLDKNKKESIDNSKKIVDLIQTQRQNYDDLSKKFACLEKNNKDNEKALNEEIKRLGHINQAHENELKKIKNEIEVLKEEDKTITETKLESVDKKVEDLDKQVSDIQNSLKRKENVGAVKISVDKQEDVTSNDSNVKSKPKKKKLTKDVIQQNIIEEFESDYRNILDDRINSGLDLKSKQCKKCEYETFSEGKLRHHKAVDHNLKETKDNIIIGFNNDVNDYLEITKAMGDDIYGLKCVK